MIRAVNLSHRYGEKILFDHASFYIGENQKVGLVGINGSGKTTLLKIITQKEIPDDGTVEVSLSPILVPQEVKVDLEMDGCPSIRKYLNPTGDIADFKIKPILAGLELSRLDLDSPATVLSGGQKTRIALVRALLQEPEILILDEPTNFLDTSGKKWLMSYLARYCHTLLIISHDLDLLGNIDKVLFIDTFKQKITEYIGNYDHFIKQRKLDEDLLIRQITSEQKHITQMKVGLVKMAHFKSGKGVRQRLNLQHRVEKAIANLPDMPQAARAIKLRLPTPLWVGELPVFLKKVTKAYGPKLVLSEVNFDIKRGERIALMGQNGAGKSTLIKIILDLVKPDSGQVIRDLKLKTGYYSQEFDQVDITARVFEFIRQTTHQPEGVIRPILAKMLFPHEKLDQKIGTLSGGEKTRLAIAALLLQDFNLLILDEPTTYLDPMSQRLILESLKEYQGSMIFVSHVPEFVSGLAPSRRFWVKENKWEL